MKTNNNVKRVMIAFVLLVFLNVLPVSAHHSEHYLSEISHLWSHILFGVVFLLIVIGFFYALSNRKKGKDKHQTHQFKKEVQ